MADENAKADTKAKTVLDDMDSRRTFDTKESAIAYITDAMQTYSDLGNYPISSPIDAKREGGPVQGFGQDEDGNLIFDPEIFPDSMQVVVAVLTTRGEGTGSSKVKSIVVYPQPRIDDVLASEQGRKWLEARYETEINRAAVRVLRDTKDSVTDLTDITVLDQMPKTLDDYVTSSRIGTSSLLEAFEEYWKAIKAALGKLSKSWKLANLPKKEFKNAMSSSAYASQYYPTLEDAALGGGKRGSLFVIALGAFKQEATKNGKDASIFDQWLNTRDSYVIEDSTDEDEDEDTALDASTLLAAMAGGDEAKPEEAPAGDAANESQETETTAAE